MEDARPERGEVWEVWTVAWPLIVTSMLNVAVGIADLKMVGALGVSSIAAVGMARHVVMFLLTVMIAISRGPTVLVAHAYGARDPRRVSEVAARSVVFTLAAAVFLVTPAGLLLSRAILVMLGGTEEVTRLGSGYLRIVFAGTAFTMFNFAVSGILLGVGKTRVSLVLLVGVNAVNIVLNYIFIFGAWIVPPMGVAGAATATVLSRFLGALAGVWVLTTKRLPIRMRFRDGWTLDVDLLRRILYLGGPRSLQGVVRNFSRLAVLRIIGLFPAPTRALSAYSVGMQVRMISAFVGLSLMSASLARVGHNKGAGRLERAERSGWAAAGLAASSMSIAALCFLVFPRQIMGFFTSDGEVVEMGRTFFIIIACTEPIMGAAFAASGALRGAGDAVAPFVYASVSDLAVLLVLGYLLGVTFGMGLTGIAIAVAVSAITRAVPTLLRFRSGKWKSMRV